MLISELFEELAYGELSNSSLKEALLTVNDDNKEAFSYVNRAIRELNKEFFINKNKHSIQLIDGVITYDIASINNIKILSVVTTEDVILSINDTGNSLFNIFTIDDNTIEYSGEVKIEEEIPSTLLLSFLQELPKATSMNDIIPLSTIYFSALTAYVGFLAQYSLGDAESATQYKIEYNTALKKLRTLGYDSEINEISSNFDSKGFV